MGGGGLVGGRPRRTTIGVDQTVASGWGPRRGGGALGQCSVSRDAVASGLASLVTGTPPLRRHKPMGAAPMRSFRRPQ